MMYLGAGIGIGIMYMLHYGHEDPSEYLAKNNALYVFGMVILDIIAPILLIVGVNLGTSSNASLLGNFEIVSTTIIAMIVFDEKISRRLWTAIILITISGMILSFDGTEGMRFSSGSLLVLGATVCWGMENNCTKNISGRSTYQIVTVKGICSGTGSLVMALYVGERVPDAKYILPALVLGFIAYGLSIFTYIRVQKYLGAARTSAYYAVAPFIGAFMSFVMLGEAMSTRYAAALAVMIAGTVLAVRDTLEQSHTHEHIHVIYHRHGGILHAHMIRHSHKHYHYINLDKHGHNHRLMYRA